MPIDPQKRALALGALNPGIAPPAAPINGLAINSPVVPNFGQAPAGPSVTRPTDNQWKLQTLQQSGDGISHIQNPLLRGIARTADITGSVFSRLALPQLGPVLATLPGTSEHHNLLVHQAQQAVDADQEHALQQAQLTGTQAKARLETAQANAAETPAAPEYDYQKTDHGIVAIQKGTTQATLLTGADGKPLQEPVKSPTNAFELWHQANPNGTLEDYNKAESKPLSAQEAQSLNGIFDHMSSKHGLPTGQFKEGMPKADALQLQTALNQAVSRQQGDTHVSVSLQGLADREKDAAAKYAPLNTNDPATQQAASSVANGSLKLSDVFGRGATTAQKAAFVAQVKAINPQYNSGDHDIENHLRNYMIAGKGGQTLTAFNTAQSHLEILRQASDALQNGNITAFNNLTQNYAKQTGDNAPTDFNAVKNAVKGEISRALTGNVTVSEQAELDKDFNMASSPRQIAGVAHKYTQLIEGKKSAMRDTYEKGARGEVNFGNDSGPPPGARVRDYTQLGGK